MYIKQLNFKSKKLSYLIMELENKCERQCMPTHMSKQFKNVSVVMEMPFTTGLWEY